MISIVAAIRTTGQISVSGPISSVIRWFYHHPFAWWWSIYVIRWFFAFLLMSEFWRQLLCVFVFSALSVGLSQFAEFCSLFWLQGFCCSKAWFLGWNPSGHFWLVLMGDARFAWGLLSRWSFALLKILARSQASSLVTICKWLHLLSPEPSSFWTWLSFLQFFLSTSFLDKTILMGWVPNILSPVNFFLERSMFID